ncbi:asparagine-linked glycosylation protein [Oleoguttula sp. CCFEE 5521]
MALIYDIAALLVGTAIVIGLIPYAIKWTGRLCGAQIRSKTRQRRELLVQRADQDERFDGESSHGEGKATTASSKSSDDGWESITPGIKTPVHSDTSYAGVIGFFHPFCNAGGGGERVLFAAILATQQRFPKALCVVYTGDHEATKEQILANARNRFNIDIKPARVTFLYLSTREYVLPGTWPHFTLLGQSLGSILLAWDAFTLLAPDIFIDTMGYAFVLATCKWLFPSVPTGAYVHYPTISTDMLSSLHDEIGSQGLNAGLGKGLKGKAKQFYWELFAKLYSRLWGPARKRRGKKHDIIVVFPPVAVGELEAKISVNAQSEQRRTRDLLYIAQFRPEKMHGVIIDAFSAFLKSYKQTADQEPKPKLILVGSVRDDHDEKRVYKLRLQAQEIKDRVQFVVNAKWPQILDFLRSSSVGVNGMWNEHFGIGVVEYQAAGLISVVNDSGGPKADIVVDIDGKPTGFHASTVEQFSAAFAKALELSPEDALALRLRARQSATRFSEEVFRDAWLEQLDHLVALAPLQKKVA